MQNIFIEFLPPWVETGRQPAFYDKESGTVLQQTARMYAKVNELVKAFNDLSEETKATVDEYIAKFVELHDYVHDYFDNLDVQEEINNKLDDMVEDGTLQEIITEYIQANTTWTFDTVADMKLAENFINGSFAQTLGYHNVNDNGAGLYKIRTVTNADVVDEELLIALADDNLVAELITKGHITPEQFGAYGDNTHDDTTKLQHAVSSGLVVHADKEYLISSISLANVKLILTGKIYGKVYVNKNVTLNGGGEIYGTANNAVVEIANSEDNPRYMDTLISNIKIHPDITGIGIYVNATTYSLYNFNVEDCEVYSADIGIKIENGNSHWVTKANFRNIFLHTPITAGIKTVNTGNLTNLGDIVFQNVYAQYQSPHPTYFADIDLAKLHFYNCFCYDGIGSYQFNVSNSSSRIFINDSIVYGSSFANDMASITAPALANGDCNTLLKVGKNIAALPDARNGMMIPTASGTTGLALSSQHFLGFVGKAGTNISSSSKYSAVGFQNGRLSVGLSDDTTAANFKMVEVTTPYAGAVYTTATLPSGSANVKNGATVWCSDIHMALTYYSNKWYKPDGTEYTP